MDFMGGGSDAAANKLTVSDVSIEQEFSWTGLSSSTSRRTYTRTTSTTSTVIDSSAPSADPEAVLHDLVLWKVLSYALGGGDEDDGDDNYLALLLVNKEWNEVVQVLEPPAVRRLVRMNREFETNGTRFDNTESLRALSHFFAQLTLDDDSTLYRKPSSNAGVHDQPLALQPQFHVAVERFVHSAQMQDMMAGLIAVAKEAVLYLTIMSVFDMWRLFDPEQEPELDLHARWKKLVWLWEKWTSRVALIDAIASGAMANNRSTFSIGRQDDGYSYVEGQARSAFACSCYRCIAHPEEEEVQGNGAPLDLLEWIGKAGVPTDTPADRAWLSKVFAAIETLKGLPWPSLEVVSDNTEGSSETTGAAALPAAGQVEGNNADVSMQEGEENKALFSPDEAAKIETVLAAIQQAFSALEESVAPALQKAKQEEALVVSAKAGKAGKEMVAVTIAVDEDEVFALPFDHHFIKSSTFLSSLQLMAGDKIKLKVDPKTMKTAMAFYDLDLVDPYDEDSRFWGGDFEEAVGKAYAGLVKDLSFQQVNDLKGLAQFFTLNKLQDLCEDTLKLPAHQEQVRRIMFARFPVMEEAMRQRLPPGATLISSHFSMG